VVVGVNYQEDLKVLKFVLMVVALKEPMNETVEEEQLKAAEIVWNLQELPALLLLMAVMD